MFQGGFSSGHSTETSLTLMTERWLKAINDCEVFDFRKPQIVIYFFISSHFINWVHIFKFDAIIHEPVHEKTNNLHRRK